MPFIIAEQSAKASPPEQHFSIASNLPAPIAPELSDLVMSSFLFDSSAVISVILLAISVDCYVRPAISFLLLFILLLIDLSLIIPSIWNIRRTIGCTVVVAARSAETRAALHRTGVSSHHEEAKNHHCDHNDW
jgi:hypothetical protein